MNTQLRRLIRLVLLASTVSCQSPGDDAAMAKAIAAYGFGPDPNGSAIYQPDVVLIDGGPRAIRSESANGLTWLIDPHARGVRELAVGKIMFASSRVVGRVIALEPRGEDLAVTLAPVELTDIVRDANVKVDFTVDPNAMTFRRLPDLLHAAEVQPIFHQEPRHGALVKVSALASASPPSDDLVLMTEPLRLYSSAAARVMRTAYDEVDQITSKGSMTVSLHGFDISASLKNIDDKLSFGLQVMRNEAAGKLKGGFEVKLLTRKLRVRTNLRVQAGLLGTSSSFVIDGIEELQVGMRAGSENGLADNVKVRIELPTELFFDIPPSPETAGLPMVVVIKTKFLFETAFSSKNSTLSAAARYGLTGPLGYENGKIHTPSFSVIKPMTDSIGGISVGVSGSVVAVEIKFLTGLGVKVAMAGPYGKLTAAFGLSRGSTIGLVECRGVNVKVDAAVGVAAQVSRELDGVLAKILGKKVSLSSDLGEVSATIVDRSATIPDVPLCKG